MSSQKNVVQVLVSDFNAETNKTTVAALPVGEIGFFKSDNTAGIAGDPGRYVLRVDADNIIESSYVKSHVAIALTSYVAPVPRVLKQTITVATVGQLYILNVAVAIKGQTGEFIHKGVHKAVTGNDVTAIAAALVTSLNASLKRSGVATFTATSALGVITITQVAQPYVEMKKGAPQRYMPISVNLVVGPAADLVAAAVDTVGTEGKGTGRQIRERELFAFGNQDSYRWNGWRNNFTPKAFAGETKEYDFQVINELQEIETANGYVLANVEIWIAFNSNGAAPAAA